MINSHESIYDFILDLFTLYRRCNDLNVQHSFAKFKGFNVTDENDYVDCVKYIFINERKFQEQKRIRISADNVISQAPMPGKYQRMLSERKRLSQNWEFNIQDAYKILDA
ncbi:hypothetical protein PL71_15760 [Pseudoalteromonas distincta]|uniref:YfbU family protein n=1 Tax=Pseudoalteromonas distincta TaxID=77608 RepID=A0ABT9GFA3_9GAMM|nr:MULTISPECIES: YfbU family protein [Pseudoalteromonas distincta group]KHM45928.1 hypothetical protein PL71_15760 [Pseudoalteromonas elyakovii]KID36409.1 hypothetical protein QT16_14025 [Pseudoalteromonas distincta]MDP4484560.1 YfbU family protein [Pseudoalteromonas elyakovii]